MQHQPVKITGQDEIAATTQHEVLQIAPFRCRNQCGELGRRFDSSEPGGAGRQPKGIQTMQRNVTLRRCSATSRWNKAVGAIATQASIRSRSLMNWSIASRVVFQEHISRTPPTPIKV